MAFAKAIGSNSVKDYSTRDKSVFAIKEVLPKGFSKRRGTACAVKKQSSGYLEYYLVTARGVVERSNIVADRYCRQYQDHVKDLRHRIKLFHDLSEERDNFCFYKLDKKPDFCVGLVKLSTKLEFKSRLTKSSLSAYTFVDSHVIQLHFKYNAGKHELEGFEAAGRQLEMTDAVGAPIIAELKIEDKVENVVIGILGKQPNNDIIFPMFFTNTVLGKYS